MSGRKIGIISTAFILLLSLAFESGQATIHDIDIVNFSFTPGKTEVTPGDTVRWTLRSGTHTTTSDAESPKQWNSGTMNIVGQTYSVVFSAGDGPGPFPYHCAFHEFSMKDTIFMASVTTTCYVDADEDGFGDPLNSVVCNGGDCSCQPGLVANDLDCNDTDSLIYPGAEEIPDDGIDQNCDGSDSLSGCCDVPGDANDDAQANVGDAVYLINFVFKGGPFPPCMNEGDPNTDCQVNVGDAVFMINFVFKGGPAPVCGCVK